MRSGQVQRVALHKGNRTTKTYGSGDAFGKAELVMPPLTAGKYQAEECKYAD